MLMSLLKSTITKWHIFSTDFARRGTLEERKKENVF